MTSLKLAESATRVTQVIYGTSPGEHEVHAPECLPIDTVIYMALIAAYRKSIDAAGLLYIDTKADRWGGSPDRQELVKRRTAALERLADRIDPGLRVVRHEELEQAGHWQDLPSEIARTLRQSMKGKPKQVIRYTEYQTQVIRACQLLLHASPGTLCKAGWVAASKYIWTEDRQEFTGGEQEFDRSLPADWGIHSHYVMPGFRMKRQQVYKGGTGRELMPAPVAAPYLLQKDHDDRCLLIESSDCIPAELAKINLGITRVGLELVKTVSALLLQETDAQKQMFLLNRDCWDWRSQQVTAHSSVDDARQHLDAALRTLLP